MVYIKDHHVIINNLIDAAHTIYIYISAYTIDCIDSVTGMAHGGIPHLLTLSIRVVQKWRLNHLRVVSDGSY